MGVYRLLHARIDRLHIDVARCANAGMSQDALCVLQRAMLLHIGSQRTSHHLKGDKTVWYAEFLSDRTNPPFEEVLPPPRNCFALPFPRPKVGNIRASGEVSGQIAFQASMTGRT